MDRPPGGKRPVKSALCDAAWFVDVTGPVTPDRQAGGLSRIEQEAQQLLLQRREAIARATPVPGDLTSHWRDWEVMAPPLDDEQRRELKAIDEALHRIADGRYGTCVECGGPLGLQRIRAIPEARYCLSCSGARPASLD